jgi:hypothetical protein
MSTIQAIVTKHRDHLLETGAMYYTMNLIGATNEEREQVAKAFGFKNAKEADKYDKTRKGAGTFDMKAAEGWNKLQ